MYCDTIWEELKKPVSKQLLREYVSHRPDRDWKKNSWKIITKNLNNYVQSRDFENVPKNYTRDMELSVKDVGDLLDNTLRGREPSMLWRKFIRGVIKLRKKDLKDAGKEKYLLDYQMFLTVLDLSESEPESEIDIDVMKNHLN